MQTIKTGLCAFGMSGKVFHAPFLKEHPGFSLTAIVERSKEESKLLYPEAQIFRSVEEMLAEAAIELVIVNTPVQTHFDYVRLALEAGKNVIVEKPFTVNAAEASELEEHSKKHGKFISVYQNRRFDRDFLQVKKILAEGKLGNIKEVEIRFDRFRTQAGGKIHKENPELPGSGALHDLGAHLVDQATQLFGAPESILGDVFSMKGNQSANDYFDLLLFYQNGLRVRLKSSSFVKEQTWGYVLHGDNGSFLQQRSDNQETELVAGATPIYGEFWQKNLEKTDGLLHYSESDSQIRIPTESQPGNYMDYYDQIYQHLVFDTPLPSPANEIILNMKIIEAALESSEKRKVIDL